MRCKRHKAFADMFRKRLKEVNRSSKCFLQVRVIFVPGRPLAMMLLQLKTNGWTHIRTSLVLGLPQGQDILCLFRRVSFPFVFVQIEVSSQTAKSKVNKNGLSPYITTKNSADEELCQQSRMACQSVCRASRQISVSPPRV